jgi:hypothetical protein
MVITIRLPLGFKPITKDDFDSDTFFPLVDYITEAVPIRRGAYFTNVPEATYRYEKRRHTKRAKARRVKNLENTWGKQATHYANAAQKYPVARYTRNNYNGTLPVARYHMNETNIPRNFNPGIPGENYLLPEQYLPRKGTAF